MVVDSPNLKKVFLLGCKHLRAIKWVMSGSKIQPNLALLCLDTRAGSESYRPCVDLNKPDKVQLHAVLADARLARSLWRLIDYYYRNRILKDVYFNIRVTSSVVQSGILYPNATCKERAAPDDHVNQQLLLIPTVKYNDVVGKIGDASIPAFPQPPTTESDLWHFEIAEGNCNVETELQDYNSPNLNLGHLIRSRAEYLHVHDFSANIASMPQGDWEDSLRQCVVERCPNISSVFPSESYYFDGLETFWASELLMTRCIWSKSPGYYMYFINLRHLHLRCCPNLQFVLPVGISSLPCLETLHIVHCSDLKHVLVQNTKYGDKIPIHGAEFPKLSAILLHDLPSLQQISEFKMVAPTLQTIRIRGCLNLQRLPAMEARGQGEQKPAVEIEKDVWDALEWDDTVQPDHFQAPLHSRYYRKKLPRGSVLR